jgi:hypothetical protein
LKFGDVIVAVASMGVTFIFVDALLGIALVPVNTALSDVAGIVSLLVSGLVVGYVFAGKIREESRMASIGKIVVLFAIVQVLGFVTFMGAVPHYGYWVDDYINSTYPTHGVTNENWMAYENMMLFALTAAFAALSLVLGFIGLYVGSMRKPSAKTKK